MVFKSLCVFNSQYLVAFDRISLGSLALYLFVLSGCFILLFHQVCFQLYRSHNPMNVECFCKIHMLNLCEHTALMIWLGLGTKTT